MNTEMNQAARNLIGSFVEDHEADAIVFAFSSVKKNKTTTQICAWGNMHACRGLADELYGHIVGEDEANEEEDEE